MSRGNAALLERFKKQILRATTHYEVLEVASDASIEEIKRVYRGLARTLHSDKDGGDVAVMQRLNAARDALADAAARAAYDLDLREAAAEKPAPKKNAARKPAAKKTAPAAKKTAPAAKKRRRQDADADAADAAEPPPAKRAHRGSCTCETLATESWPVTAYGRLAKCNAGEPGPHDCACPALFRTIAGTRACRSDADHWCVCAAAPASALSGAGADACRALAHDCSCRLGRGACRAERHDCSCGEVGVAGCLARRGHACVCEMTADPASCLAPAHACACGSLIRKWFRGPASCRSAPRHACICAAGREPEACRAGGGHDCACLVLPPRAALFAPARWGDTARCHGDDHECICAAVKNPADASLCRARVHAGAVALFRPAAAYHSGWPPAPR